MWGVFAVFTQDDGAAERIFVGCHIIPCYADGRILGAHAQSWDCPCHPIMDSDDHRVAIHNEIH